MILRVDISSGIGCWGKFPFSHIPCGHSLSISAATTKILDQGFAAFMTMHYGSVNSKLTTLLGAGRFPLVRKLTLSFSLQNFPSAFCLRRPEPTPLIQDLKDSSGLRACVCDGLLRFIFNS